MHLQPSPVEARAGLCLWPKTESKTAPATGVDPSTGFFSRVSGGWAVQPVKWLVAACLQEFLQVTPQT
jgi:hypothetical protein